MVTRGSQIDFENHAEIFYVFLLGSLGGKAGLRIAALLETYSVFCMKQSSCAERLLTGRFQQHKLHSQPVASEDCRSAEKQNVGLSGEEDDQEHS